MAGIQFENEEEFARPASYGSEPRGMTALVMKWGLAKDEKTARYLLMGVVLICGIVILLFLFGSGHQGAAKLSPSDIQRITNLQTGLHQ